MMVEEEEEQACERVSPGTTSHKLVGTLQLAVIVFYMVSGKVEAVPDYTVLHLLDEEGVKHCESCQTQPALSLTLLC